MEEKQRGIPAWYAWVTIVFGLLCVIGYQAMIISDRGQPGDWVPTYAQAYFTVHDVAPYPNLRNTRAGYYGPSDMAAYGYMLAAETDDPPQKVVDFYRSHYPSAKVSIERNRITLEAKTKRGDDLYVFVEGQEIYIQTNVKIRRTLGALSP